MIPVSVIVPTLNEAANIGRTLSALAPLRGRGCEVIVADGGSSDGTAEAARPHADAVICAHRGRASQMNAGADAARGEVLWFLHADTTPPDDADRLIVDGLAASGRNWGRFDIRLTGDHPLLRLVERGMNLRSRVTGICTGDQAIFVRREAFDRAGGFPPVALMEDLAVSARLKAGGPPLCLRERVNTSSRRWEANGVLRTVLGMWGLRLMYFLGADSARLARLYDRGAI
jgi:rSAM/selenodomain-associated transferase 2